MKLLIVILLALAASLAIAYVAVDDPGYVLITLQPWSVELSFSLFVVLLVALFIATYLVVRFLVRIWGTPKDISMWRKRRLKGKAHLSQTQGMMGLIEGDWPKAEKQLLSYLSHTDTPVLNFLGAAHAAQAQGDLERRDRYLIQARDSDPRQTVAHAQATANSCAQKQKDTRAANADLSRSTGLEGVVGVGARGPQVPGIAGG
jgi:HemY protein